MDNKIIQQLAKFKTQDLVEYLLLRLVEEQKIKLSDYDQYYGMVSTEAKLTVPFSTYFEENAERAGEIYVKLRQEMDNAEFDKMEDIRQQDWED